MQTQPSLTLDRYLSERGPMDPVQAAKIAIQVARQLSQAGDALLVHPARILVGKDGSVRLLPPPAEDLALPAIVEFPAYASPEEARGGHPDLRSGLYSLGCTLHELLTGRPPYSAGDPKQMLKAHLESPVPDLRKLSPKTPPALAEIVKELLAKDPEERVQTPEELVRRLRQSIGVPAGTAPQAPPRATAPPPVAAAPRSPTPAARRGQPRSGSKAGTSAARGAAARRPGTPRGAAVARGSARAHARRGGEEDLEEEEVPARPEPSKRSRSFTIAGTVIGLLLGALLVLRTMSQREPEPDKASIVETEKARVLAERKQRFLDQQAEIEKGVRATLAEARKRQGEERREYLTRSLQAVVDTRWGHLLSQELMSMGPAPPKQMDAKEAAEVDAEYAAVKAEALRIYSEGRIGDAIDFFMKDYSKFKARHDAEITDYVEKRWSNEITQKWEETKKEMEKLGLDGNVEGAIAALEKALVYGDKTVKDDAEELIKEHKSRGSLIEENKLKVEAGREKELENAPDVKEDPGEEEDPDPDL